MERKSRKVTVEELNEAAANASNRRQDVEHELARARAAEGIYFALLKKASATTIKEHMLQRTNPT